MSVPRAVIWALQECPYDSQDVWDLRTIVTSHSNVRWDDTTSKMTTPVAEAVAAALNDCSHMGPEFVALFYAIREAMLPEDVSHLRYTALRIAETRGLAPTREALDRDLDEIRASVVTRLKADTSDASDASDASDTASQ